MIVNWGLNYTEPDSAGEPEAQCTLLNEWKTFLYNFIVNFRQTYVRRPYLVLLYTSFLFFYFYYCNIYIIMIEYGG